MILNTIILFETNASSRSQVNYNWLTLVYRLSPTFWEFALGHFAFMKDLHDYLFLPTERNLKTILLWQKQMKSDNSDRCLSCSELYRGSMSSGSKGGPAKLPAWKLLSASLHQATITLNCICDHLCFTLIYFVPLLARCARRYQRSPNEFTFWVWEFLEMISHKLMATVSLLYKVLD